MQKYVLENVEEFERLERQSKNIAYSFEKELNEFLPKSPDRILDAGCGSGVVGRYLATQNPKSKVIGCDFSSERIEQAKLHSQGIQNISFETQNLNELTFQNNSFDLIICRYVLEHLLSDHLINAMKEFKRCLNTNGKFIAIDMDGFIYNLYPQTELVEKVIFKLKEMKPLDLHIGRKIPKLMEEAGFKNVAWKIETHSFTGESLEVELSFIRERFEQAKPFLISFLESENEANRFIEEYFDCARQAGAVLFFNKFIVSGEKTGLKII